MSQSGNYKQLNNTSVKDNPNNHHDSQHTTSPLPSSTAAAATEKDNPAPTSSALSSSSSVINNNTGTSNEDNNPSSKRSSTTKRQTSKGNKNNATTSKQHTSANENGDGDVTEPLLQQHHTTESSSSSSEQQQNMQKSNSESSGSALPLSLPQNDTSTFNNSSSADKNQNKYQSPSLSPEAQEEATAAAEVATPTTSLANDFNNNTKSNEPIAGTPTTIISGDNNSTNPNNNTNNDNGNNDNERVTFFASSASSVPIPSASVSHRGGGIVETIENALDAAIETLQNLRIGNEVNADGTNNGAENEPTEEEEEEEEEHEHVLVHHHEPTPRVENLEDIQSRATAPTLLSAARTLDINLDRVKKGRRMCVSNLFILFVCLGLQCYAWCAYYNITICDKYLDGSVEYSLSNEIRALKTAIAVYDPSPITGGGFLPASFGISSSPAADADTAVISRPARVVTELHNITIRNKDRIDSSPSAGKNENSNDAQDEDDLVISVGNFTSYFLEAQIPYSDFEGQSLSPSITSAAAMDKVQVQFSFASSSSSSSSSSSLSTASNFTRTIPLTINASTLAQPVVEPAWCFPSTVVYSVVKSMAPSYDDDDEAWKEITSCNETVMRLFCTREYGSNTAWVADDKTKNNGGTVATSGNFSCDVFSACGTCQFNRFLKNYSVVIKPTTAAATTTASPSSSSSLPPSLVSSTKAIVVYKPDGYFSSPLWPFNNGNFPPFSLNPQEDASSVFVTPSEAVGGTSLVCGVSSDNSNRNNRSASSNGQQQSRLLLTRSKTSSSSSSSSSSSLFAFRGIPFTPKPSYVTIRVYLSSDPFIVFQRYTQGLGEFTTFESAAAFMNQSHADGSLPSFSFRMLDGKYPIGCGVPELISAWGVFLIMFIYTVYICKKFPNFALEADVGHDVETEYEDYDRSESDDEHDENAEEGEEGGTENDREGSAAAGGGHRSDNNSNNHGTDINGDRGESGRSNNSGSGGDNRPAANGKGSASKDKNTKKESGGGKNANKNTAAGAAASSRENAKKFNAHIEITRGAAGGSHNTSTGNNSTGSELQDAAPAQQQNSSASSPATVSSPTTKVQFRSPKEDAFDSPKR